jgi:hypothetical protein
MSKTVRLPIYDGDMMTNQYLEVDLEFFIPPSSKVLSNQARIKEHELADWEKELLKMSHLEDEVEVSVKPITEIDWEGLSKLTPKIDVQELLGNYTPAEEWRTLEGLPTKSFQINQRGQVRHKFNQKIIEPSLDLDSKNYMTVQLTINGLDWFINGPKVAEQMWGK